MTVGVRSAGLRRDLNPRPAKVIALIDRPGYRRNSAIIEYEDGEQAELPLTRLAPAP